MNEILIKCTAECETIYETFKEFQLKKGVIECVLCHESDQVYYVDQTVRCSNDCYYIPDESNIICYRCNIWSKFHKSCEICFTN